MKKLSVLLAFFASLIIFGGQLASANDTDSKFNVEVVKSDKQRDQAKTWYDLKMNPNESTALTLKVTNRDTTASTFDLVASQAPLELE